VEDDEVLWATKEIAPDIFVELCPSGKLLVVQMGELPTRIKFDVLATIRLYRLLQRYKQALINAAVREALDGDGQRRGQ
jgi:hypothetical protein